MSMFISKCKAVAMTFIAVAALYVSDVRAAQGAVLPPPKTPVGSPN